MVDVTVMGAGAFGLAVAWACQDRGASVRVIDPGGVAAGASGGLVGALAPHTPENWNEKKAFQFESLLMAEKFWSTIEAEGGLPSGYGRTGRVQPIQNQRGLELARDRVASAAELWQGKARWEVVEQGHFEMWEPHSPTGYLIFDTLSARMHPRRACAALAAAIESRGGEIAREGRQEGKIVWATGWRGLMDLSEKMEKPLGNGVKGQAALLAFSRPDHPQLYADAVHIVPHADGTVAIGSTSEREFNSPDTTDDQLDDVLARAMAAVPELAGGRVIERWAGVRPRARSRAPMLGRHPLDGDQFIANGGFKIGFGMAPKVGAAMADLILENHDVIPDGFRPEASL